MKPCPFCGAPAAHPQLPTEFEPKKFASCSRPPYLYDQPERGGCVMARIYMPIEMWDTRAGDRAENGTRR